MNFSFCQQNKYLICPVFLLINWTIYHITYLSIIRYNQSLKIIITMLNTTNNSSTTNIKTPASGIIQKSDNKSFFLRFHQKSKLSDDIFNSNPKYKGEKIVVIQVILLSEEQLLCEIVNESDFNIV